MPATDTDALPKKTRVCVTSKLAGVPEGTAGSVQGTVGLTFPRHRVAFDNGRLVTSVDRRLLVREKEWGRFEEAREQEAAAALEAKSEPPVTAPAAESGGAAVPADDRLAALLARSKAAREKAAAD